MQVLMKYKYGILFGLLCLVVLAPFIWYWWFLEEIEEMARRTQTRENLQTLGIKLAKNAQELAGDLKGSYPPMSSEANRLMFTTEGFLPEYLPAPELLVCPSLVSKGIPQEFDDACYFYTGYALVSRGYLLPVSSLRSGADLSAPDVFSSSERVMSDFSAFYNKQIANSGDFWERYVREGNIDIYRIREGVRVGYDEILDREGDDIQDNIVIFTGHVPVLIEWPDNTHSSEKLGGNVLWLDGHVSWVKYPGNFPMTEEAMAIFTELAGRPPIGHLE